MLYESLRQAARDFLRPSDRRTAAWLVVLFGTGLYPLYYNHSVTFLYINDRWYGLLPVQLFFTITDDVCLALRWSQSHPELRALIRGSHVLFNLLLETQKLHPRSLMFLLDDVAALGYIWWLYNRSRRLPRARRGSSDELDLETDERSKSRRPVDTQPFSRARLRRALKWFFGGAVTFALIALSATHHGTVVNRIS
jgi:hypothetical protein